MQMGHSEGFQELERADRQAQHLACNLMVPVSGLGAVAESVERRPRVKEIGSSVSSRVKLVTYIIDTCRFLDWRSELIGYAKDWLAQCQDNATAWYIRS